MNKTLLTNIKKSIVFIWTLNHINSMDTAGKAFTDVKEQFVWTGCLVKIDGIVHLLTAKHVVLNIDQNGKVVNQKQNLKIFVNQKISPKLVWARDINWLKTKWLSWIYHNKQEIDIALIPLVLDIGKDDITVLDIQSFWQKVTDLMETDDLFYVAYQPNVSELKTDGNVSPVIRKGSIAKVNNEHKCFYIDWAAFPWNSWSPVFRLPSIFKDIWPWVQIWPDRLWWSFLGIINRYVPYQEVAVSTQTGRPRIIFEENTGLSHARSLDVILEIIAQEDFKRQIEKIKSGILIE